MILELCTIQITNKTIDGKEYMVLTGYPSSMSFDQSWLVLEILTLWTLP